MFAKTIIYSVLILAAGSNIISRCTLARYLREIGIRHGLIPDWVCLADAVSGRNTTAKGQHGMTHTYGIFQISDQWCALGRKGKRCDAKCEDFLSDDLAESVFCALEIFADFGFHAWSEWEFKCKGKPLPDVLGCLKY